MHGLTDKEADDVWVRVGDHDNSDPGDTEVEQPAAHVSRVPQFLQIRLSHFKNH